MRSNPSISDDLRDALAAEPDAADLERVWHLLGSADAPAPDTDAADADWQAVRRRLTSTRAADRPSAPAARRVHSRWPVAVALVACLGVALWALLPVTHRAALGETASVTLPDGSGVVLNSGASIRHARFFSAARDVSLTGEAFFDVRPGDVPFVVETHNAHVEVLGTAFNVRAWDDQTTVALVEGRVALSGPGLATTQMTAGDALRLLPGQPAPEPLQADVGRASAWRSGSLAFQEMPLAAVLAEVERRYAISFTPETGTPLGIGVSAFYAQRPAIDVLLGDLGAAAGVQFTPTADGYSLRTAGRRTSSSSSTLPRAAP
jgi:ferric-dicitrate binding protein FerR (iron transport regulator)